MDDMDVDNVVEVPDTPDRLARNFNGKSCIRRENHISSTSNLFGNADISNDGLIGGLRNKNERATKRESKSMSIPPRNCSNKSELQGNIRKNSSGAGISTGSVFHSKRIVGENIYNNGEKTSIQPEYIGKGKAISSYNSQMPAHEGRNTVVDLTEQDDHSKQCTKFIVGSSQASQHRKEMLGKSSSSLLDEDSANGNKFENPRTLNKTSSQKRLVRNGCISPLNVAKATQSVSKENHSFPHSHQDGSGTSRESMDSRRVKGKGLLTHNILPKESDAKTRPLSDRTHAGKVDITSLANEDAFEQSNRASGWISTCGHTRKLNPLLPDEEHLLLRRAGDPTNVNKLPRNEMVRSNNKEGSNARKHPVSSQNVSVAPITQTVSRRHQGCLLNDCPGPSNLVLKRKKQGSSRSHGDSSSSAVDNSELVVLGSPGEPSNVRSVGTQNSHTARSFNRIIDIDDISPETRSNSSYNINNSNNRESVVRARQLEADEIFARELQEQLYNESNVAADREIDENVALALQQGSLPHAFTRGTHHVSHSRSSLVPNLHRQNQSRPSQNSTTRRVTQARNPASTRMARPRGHIPGQSRTISSRQRNAMFPSDMDVDMRMHILEALEAFNDMGVAGNILQAQRDFNENDYEMLLALDENNHHHGGASASQINGLPESTVQTDNLEECSICLETPSIGDTIRHLPCLHKFHKDCIDEWLRRKTSCPVCKSSIT